MTTLRTEPHPVVAPARASRGVGGFVVRVVAWLVILATTSAVVVTVLVPRVAGATPYAVLTGSMRPDLPPGTLIVVRPVEVADLGVGDVITYQLRSGEPAVVTHRVVGMGYDGTGELRLQTQGDANDVADDDAVLPVQVRGELWYSVPLLGHLHVWLSSDQRDLLTHLLAALLLLYAARAFLRAFAERRRREVEA